MANKFAIVVLLPESVNNRLDFVSREFESLSEIQPILKEVEEKAPNWRVISFCHIEDLPLMMEPIDAPQD